MRFLLPSLGQAIAYNLGQGGRLETLEASISLGFCLWVPAGREMNQCVHSPVTHGMHLCRPPRFSWPLGWCWGQAGGVGRERRGSRWLTICPALPTVPLSLEDACNVPSAFPKDKVGIGRARISNMANGLHAFLASQGTKGPTIAPLPN